MSTKQIYKNKVPSLNYKTFSGFPSLEKTAADLTGPVSQQLVPESFF